MLNASQIKGLHIEKSKAKLSEEAYRQILREVADVSSSKDESLGEREYWAIIKAIKADGSRRQGWQLGQLKKFKQYAFFCGLSETQARQELYKLTGRMHEEDASLKQSDFDYVMACLEERLESLVASGGVEAPEGFELDYWRNRLPDGKLSSRQCREVATLWGQLQPYLPEEKRTLAYLHGIAASLLRLKTLPGDVGELSGAQGVRLVDALKRRIAQEARQIVCAVPF